MLLHDNPIMQETHNDPFVIPTCRSHFFPVIYFFSFVSLFFCCEGGKGVKKAIKKVASGLVRDAEKSWFAELSDKGKMDEIYHSNFALLLTVALQ